MQYSPQCAIPYVSMVDGGTVELVRGAGVEVVTSAELIQTFEARWTPEALESHLEAGRRVDRIRAEAFALIRERTRNGAPLQEVEVKRFVREAFAKGGPGHRPRTHRGRERQRLQPALRTDRRGHRAYRRGRFRAAGHVGQAGSARAPSTTTSPGPASAATAPRRPCATSSPWSPERATPPYGASRAPWPPASPCAATRWTTRRAGSSRAADSAP